MFAPHYVHRFFTLFFYHFSIISFLLFLIVLHCARRIMLTVINLFLSGGINVIFFILFRTLIAWKRRCFMGSILWAFVHFFSHTIFALRTTKTRQQNTLLLHICQPTSNRVIYSLLLYCI